MRPLHHDSESDYRENVESLIRNLYRKAGLTEPKSIAWHPSPYALCADPAASARSLRWEILPEWVTTLTYQASSFMPSSLRTARESDMLISRQLWADSIFPSQDYCFFKPVQGFIEFHITCVSNHNHQKRDFLHALRRVGQVVELMKPCDGICHVAKPPVEQHRDKQGRYHCQTGPAAVYADGWKIYALNGLCVPAAWIEDPACITAAKIDECANAELRRIMISLYKGDYYSDCGAELVATDAVGRLYRKKRKGDSDFTFVRVTNSTREPDGTFREYVLRVPPKTSTLVEGIAWTFGMTAEQYLKTQKMT